jgi:hypothetical protein
VSPLDVSSLNLQRLCIACFGLALQDDLVFGIVGEVDLATVARSVSNHPVL